MESSGRSLTILHGVELMIRPCVISTRDDLKIDATVFESACFLLKALMI